MSEHLKRVELEALELEDRINRLASFLDYQSFLEVKVEEYELLKEQWLSMRQYLSILHQRLRLRNKSNDDTE